MRIGIVGAGSLGTALGQRLASIFRLITGIVALFCSTPARVLLVPRLAITTAIAVPVMTWILIPRITRLLRGWLYPVR